MNHFVADPHWGWWIVWYFYLGGIAAGAYFMATLIELVGDERDRAMGRAGYFIAAPLVVVCGALLIADLEQPSRFWHMLLDAETLRPHVKPWSPMSVGAWALLLFGAISSVSFVGALVESRRCALGRWAGFASRLHRGVLGRGFDLIGCACGFFIASYTGALLTATNQPVWSDSPWIAALFLASSATTGIAALQLAAGSQDSASKNSHSKLRSVESWAFALELALLALFIASFRPTESSPAVEGGPMRTLVGLVLIVASLGVICPLTLRHWSVALGRRSLILASVLSLAGGLLLRYVVLTAAPDFLHHAAVERQTPPWRVLQRRRAAHERQSQSLCLALNPRGDRLPRRRVGRAGA